MGTFNDQGTITINLKLLEIELNYTVAISMIDEETGQVGSGEFYMARRLIQPTISIPPGSPPITK